MPTINFFYRSKKDAYELTLRFVHKTKSEKIDLWTKSTYIIESKYWNSKKRVVKGTDAKAKNHRINLLKFENRLLELFSLDFNKGVTIDKDWLNNSIEIYFNRTIKEEKLNLLEYYSNYIEKYSDIPLPTTGKPLAKSSIKTYRSAMSLLEKFHYEEYTLNFNKITIDFYEDYLNFLYDLNYSTNYIGSQIKTLKTIMNASFEDGLHSNTDYQKRAFKKPTEEVYNTYLDQQELERIFNVDLESFTNKKLSNGLVLSPKKLDIARDLFLIGANTGLRVSDFTRITEKNILKIKGKKYIKIDIKKTGDSVTIPMNQTVLDIIDKYKNNSIPTLPHQHINYAIKEICKLAEINETISKRVTKGRLKVEQMLMKYEMISNHTARRSFCTNAYKSGMPSIDIMTISGHKSEKVFLNYIKATEEEKAIKIGEHNFFNQATLKKA